MNILVTGAAGFIGMATAQRLLARGDEVVGLAERKTMMDRKHKLPVSHQ